MKRSVVVLLVSSTVSTVAACGSDTSSSDATSVRDAGFDAASSFVPADAGSLADRAGSPETCNGVDDDNDGLVDNVDVGNDGVCDCLKVATLGVGGSAGVGDVFAAWLSARSTAGATALGSQVLTPALLAPFQVIVAEDVHTIGRAYAASEVKALADWIALGGGFMTLTGYSDPSEVANVNTLLAPHGIQYGSTPILYVGGSTVAVTSWVPHAVTQGVSRLGIDNGYEVQGGGVLLASEQGFDVLRATESGKGHVLVWGDEWITYDSEWKGHADYQVQLFWLNAIKWLTTAAQCQVPIPPNVK